MRWRAGCPADRLAPALAAAVQAADEALAPFEAVLAGLVTVGDILAERVSSTAAQRRAIVRASPELQERERTKFAAVADTLADALEQRGAPTAEADLLAQVGIAIFVEAFARWAQDTQSTRLADLVREVAAELAAHLGTAR
ncbi:hypothetical protein [Nocardia macrotermitis]|uniref:hypothetical protein n=1 Tax=Nocardia macrotermitis TaxID=2585198 RepID=UPI001885E3C0|nr:hypothetical protein [Nocardia macrotermitis]